MRLFCVDPGSTSSGFVDCEYNVESDSYTILEAADADNEIIREKLFDMSVEYDVFRELVAVLAIEEPTVIGQRFIQKEVLQAAVETGRFIESPLNSVRAERLYRRDVLKLLFGTTPKNADTHVKALLREKIGDVGSPKTPGPLIKLRGLKHAWQALGCGVAAITRLKLNKEI